ncbi:hypothetical protein P691DRAFT_620959, partial [Macrolepiota fuliginosa MF-IS2]
LDNIIIWSQSFEEHLCNVHTALEAFHTNSLFCSMKKSQLFCDEVIFLGHHIS